MRFCRRLTSVSTVLAVVIGATASAALPSAGAAMNRQLGCSSKGLSFSYKRGGATFADRVADLRTAQATCTTARFVATSVTQKLLHQKRVPATAEGFTVHVKSPCSGCSPIWRVTATQGTARIRFNVLGGA